MSESPPQSLNEKLEFITKNLRVPDFKYDYLEPEVSSVQVAKLQSKLSLASSERVESLITFRDDKLAGESLPDYAVNTLFIADRVFDVWLRKVGLDELLLPLFSQYRLHMALIILGHSTALNGFLELLDTLAIELRSWCANPERAQKQVVNLLESIANELCSNPDDSGVRIARELANAYTTEREAKKQKIEPRLVATEERHARTRFSGAIAQSLINKVFANKSMSPAASSFLSEYWLQVLATSIADSKDLSISEDFLLLTKRFRAVFVEKGQSAFRHSDDLLDLLDEASKAHDVSIPGELMQGLSAEMIEILKGVPVEASHFEALDIAEGLERFRDHSVNVSLNDWFIDAETRHRECLAYRFKESGQFLFVNHLGMKMGVDTEASLSERLKTKQLRKLTTFVSLSQVLATTLTGLFKVSSTQLQAREKAAKKAKEEALRIREEQESAAQRAQQQAADIAKRTREIAQKKEEAKRLRDQQRAIELIEKLSLGAWISILAGEERSRFKLAVKFAAKKRYVFVDKYGVKKVEYNEDHLVDEICSGAIEILSDGADFDDSLERVIGRMRIAR